MSLRRQSISSERPGRRVTVSDRVAVSSNTTKSKLPGFLARRLGSALLVITGMTVIASCAHAQPRSVNSPEPSQTRPRYERPQEIVVATRLTRDQIAERLVAAVANETVGPSDVQRIFGIPEEFAQLGRDIRVLDFPDNPDTVQHRFSYRLVRCPPDGAIPSWIPCTQESLQLLDVFIFDSSYQPIHAQERSTCITNIRLLDQLLALGWTFLVAPEEINRPYNPDRSSPDYLGNGRTYVMIYPTREAGEYCLKNLKIFSQTEAR